MIHSLHWIRHLLWNFLLLLVQRLSKMVFSPLLILTKLFQFELLLSFITLLWLCHSCLLLLSLSLLVKPSHPRRWCAMIEEMSALHFIALWELVTLSQSKLLLVVGGFMQWKFSQMSKLIDLRHIEGPKVVFSIFLLAVGAKIASIHLFLSMVAVGLFTN